MEDAEREQKIKQFIELTKELFNVDEETAKKYMAGINNPMCSIYGLTHTITGGNITVDFSKYPEIEEAMITGVQRFITLNNRPPSEEERKEIENSIERERMLTRNKSGIPEFGWKYVVDDETGEKHLERNENEQVIINYILDYRKEQRTLEEIKTALARMGVKIAKNTIRAICKKYGVDIDLRKIQNISKKA